MYFRIAEGRSIFMFQYCKSPAFGKQLLFVLFMLYSFKVIQVFLGNNESVSERCFHHPTIQPMKTAILPPPKKKHTVDGSEILGCIYYKTL